MPEATRVDVQRMRDIAASVGVLLENHGKQFEELYGFEPRFGDFDSARWLGELVTDRRDAVLAHVAYLNRTLSEIQAALVQIAGEMDETDAANAAAVAGINAPRDR